LRPAREAEPASSAQSDDIGDGPRDRRSWCAEFRFNTGAGRASKGKEFASSQQASSCQILRLLSTDGDDPQYRVKCPKEGFERVVRESELRGRAL
jgi:hypothetical protein